VCSSDLPKTPKPLKSEVNIQDMEGSTAVFGLLLGLLLALHILWISELYYYAGHIVSSGSIRHRDVSLCNALVHQLLNYERCLALDFRFLEAILFAQLCWRRNGLAGNFCLGCLGGRAYDSILGPLLSSLADKLDGLLVGEAVPYAIACDYHKVMFWFYCHFLHVWEGSNLMFFRLF